MLRSITNLLLWLLAFAGSLFLIFQFQAGILALCLYSLALILFLSRLMIFAWLRPLIVEREVSHEVIPVGNHVSVLVKITNPSFLPILWMYVEETLPPRISIDGTVRRLLFLPPRRSFYLHYRMTPSRRGCHQIGPLIMESGDIFGLFKRSRLDSKIDFVTALPAYQIVEDYQVGQRRRLGDLAAVRSIHEDPTNIRGVREYSRGDPLKRVHWKSSARTGRLYTKVFESVMTAGVVIALDFHQDAWVETQKYKYANPSHDSAAELAATIARYLTDGGWEVGLVTNGRDPLGIPGVTLAQARSVATLRQALEAARRRRPDDRLEPILIPPRRGAEQFATIHENLGRIELSDGLTLEAALYETLPHIARDQVLSVITGQMTDSLATALHRARELGYRVMVFIVDNPRAHDVAFELLVPAGIDVHIMDENWRLREIAIGRQFI